MSGLGMRWIVQSKMRNSGSLSRATKLSVSIRNSGWAKPSFAALMSASKFAARSCPQCDARGKHRVFLLGGRRYPRKGEKLAAKLLLRARRSDDSDELRSHSTHGLRVYSRITVRVRQ